MNKNFVRNVVVHIIQFPLHFMHFTTLCTNISIHAATRLGTAIPPSHMHPCIVALNMFILKLHWCLETNITKSQRLRI